jgi:HAD superfamily hydrolase (TIGR01509 family)
MMRGVLLDLDGTLVDSEEQNAEAVARALATMGRPMTAEERHYVIGHGWREIYDHLEAGRPTGYAFEALLAAAARERERLIREEGLRVLPGVKEAIRRLCARVPVGVVTGSAREEAELVLSLLGVRAALACVVTAEDVPRGKPSPDGFLLGASRLALSPGGCLAVEDSEAGIRAAHAAGMRCVAVAAGNFARQDQSGADVVIETLDDLDDALLLRLYAREGAGAGG